MNIIKKIIAKIKPTKPSAQETQKMQNIPKDLTITISGTCSRGKEKIAISIAAKLKSDGFGRVVVRGTDYELDRCLGFIKDESVDIVVIPKEERRYIDDKIDFEYEVD